MHLIGRLVYYVCSYKVYVLLNVLQSFSSESRKYQQQQWAAAPISRLTCSFLHFCVSYNISS